MGYPEIEVVSFEVTNIGLRPVRVTGFGWRFGWLSRGPKLLKYRWAIQTDDLELASQNPPLDLESGHKANYLIKPLRFQNRLSANDDLFQKRPVLGLGSIAPRICRMVHTARGTRLIVKIESNLKIKLTISPAQIHSEADV